MSAVVLVLTLLVALNWAGMSIGGSVCRVTPHGLRCSRSRFECLVPRYDAALLAATRSGGAARSRDAVAVIILALEADAAQLACTLHSFDAAYNGRRLHDYLVFSEAPWSAAGVAALRRETDAVVRFEHVPASAWAQSPGVRRSDAEAAWRRVDYYGNTDAYRRMCRFFSGPAFLLPALREYTYFWRLDAHVRYLCDLDDPATDPVALLAASGGVYAYGISMVENAATVPSLWATTAAYAASRNLSDHVRSSWGEGSWARMCHYWSNLEVGRVAFFAGAEYQDYFRALDTAGGFTLERWGDAPVRTLGLMLHADPAQVLYLEGVGYQHPPNYRCPAAGRPCAGRPRCEPDMGFAGDPPRFIGDGLRHDEGCAVDAMLQ